MNGKTLLKSLVSTFLTRGKSAYFVPIWVTAISLFIIFLVSTFSFESEASQIANEVCAYLGTCV
jgi:hypothetical protein